ncbi:unnamed protein product [Vitrella brassicaformis CCMP3155]|uniref:Uncharacterized protein n=3 Tax=Vitrella brassicaformis TaxID=1169539 RepID=A0A0G4EHK0_VITBC|nr:unnamed protein product [Vitrella brassicaformis CCMP3155]|eukprot:CEL95660.1 unnamed protein product [Vitrella brassicaformis CCMP3155]
MDSSSDSLPGPPSKAPRAFDMFANPFGRIKAKVRDPPQRAGSRSNASQASSASAMERPQPAANNGTALALFPSAAESAAAVAVAAGGKPKAEPKAGGFPQSQSELPAAGSPSNERTPAAAAAVVKKEPPDHSRQIVPAAVPTRSPGPGELTFREADAYANSLITPDLVKQRLMKVSLTWRRDPGVRAWVVAWIPAVSEGPKVAKQEAFQVTPLTKDNIKSTFGRAAQHYDKMIDDNAYGCEEAEVTDDELEVMGKSLVEVMGLDKHPAAVAHLASVNWFGKARNTAAVCYRGSDGKSKTRFFACSGMTRTCARRAIEDAVRWRDQLLAANPAVLKSLNLPAAPPPKVVGSQPPAPPAAVAAALPIAGEMPGGGAIVPVTAHRERDLNTAVVDAIKAEFEEDEEQDNLPGPPPAPPASDAQEDQQQQQGPTAIDAEATQLLASLQQYDRATLRTREPQGQVSPHLSDFFTWQGEKTFIKWTPTPGCFEVNVTVHPLPTAKRVPVGDSGTSEGLRNALSLAVRHRNIILDAGYVLKDKMAHGLRDDVVRLTIKQQQSGCDAPIPELVPQDGGPPKASHHIYDFQPPPPPGGGGHRPPFMALSRPPGAPAVDDTSPQTGTKRKAAAASAGDGDGPPAVSSDRNEQDGEQPPAKRPGTRSSRGGGGRRGGSGGGSSGGGGGEGGESGGMGVGEDSESQVKKEPGVTDDGDATGGAMAAHAFTAIATFGAHKNPEEPLSTEQLPKEACELLGWVRSTQPVGSTLPIEYDSGDPSRFNGMSAFTVKYYTAQVESSTLSGLKTALHKAIVFCTDLMGRPDISLRPFGETQPQT